MKNLPKISNGVNNSNQPKSIKRRSVKRKIFGIILVFTIGMVTVLGIIYYGMKIVSLVVPLLRGERLTNAIPVRDMEIYFKDYLLTESEQSKEDFLRAYRIAVAGGTYGKLIKEGADTLAIETELEERTATPGYEKDALIPGEIERAVSFGFQFREMKKIRKLLELAYSYGEKLDELLPAFEQLIEIKETPLEEEIKQEKLRSVQLQIEALFKEMYLQGAEFSQHTGKVTYWMIDLITTALLLVIIIFIIVGLIIGFFISRSITNPLAKLVTASKAVAKGDFKQRVKKESEDEIGDLATSFNKMAEDLKKSYTAIEESKITLEIKVKDRTRELKELTESLEKQVKARTEELQKKVEELEKFNKLAVGRELKMIELKKEIKKLKEGKIN